MVIYKRAQSTENVCTSPCTTQNTICPFEDKLISIYVNFANGTESRQRHSIYSNQLRITEQMGIMNLPYKVDAVDVLL